MLDCNHHNSSAFRVLQTSMGNQLGTIKAPSDLTEHCRLPTSHVCPLLRPPVAIHGDIPKRFQPPCDWTKQLSQVAIGEAVGKFIANEVKEVIKNHPTIEVFHVFTHQGGHPSN